MESSTVLALIAILGIATVAGGSLVRVVVLGPAPLASLGVVAVVVLLGLAAGARGRGLTPYWP